jgi:multidrug resistance efflux pump
MDETLRTGSVRKAQPSAEIQPAGRLQDLGRIHEALLRIASTPGDENQVRSQFRQLALRIPGAIGAGHVIYQNEVWDLKPQHVTGRCPRRSDFQAELGVLCQSVFERRAIQIRKITGEFLATMYLAPIQVFGCEPEVFILLLDLSPPNAQPNTSSTQRNRQAAVKTESQESAELLCEDQGLQARRLLEAIAAGLNLWKQNTAAQTGDWKLASMAAVIDLCSRIEQALDLKGASRVLVNEYSRHTGCPNVALGWISKREIRLQAISGEHQVSLRSEVVQSIEQTLNESLVRRQPGRWSFQGVGDGEPLLLLHKQLAHLMEVECVLTWPLTTVDDESVGVWLFAGPVSIVMEDRFQRLMRVAAPRVATALNLVARSQPGRITRWLSKGRAWAERKTTWVAAAFVLAFVALMMIPVPYQVRTRVTAQPEFRRFAVAPFEGQIEATFKRVGDEVQQDELLARFDGRQLRWQLLSTTAEKERAAREREMELSAQNAAAALLAELEVNRLAAEQVALEDKLSQLEIRSPAPGVILSASLDRAEAAAVAIGDALFEIGSYHPIIMELSISMDDVSQVAKGQAVRIWMDGQGEPIDGTVDLIRPVSELRLSQNVFIAEVKIGNQARTLRPGMMGRARIRTASHALGWNLFHKPWNFVRSQLNW